MLQISGFHPKTKVPYYYSCIYPLIHEQMGKYGSASNLSLIPNLQFLGLPTYIRNSSNLTRIDSTNSAKQLGYQSAQEYMKINVQISSLADYQTGFVALKQVLKHQKLFIVSGSSYFLPYCKDYRNPAYLENYPSSTLGVADHWVAVYGIDNKVVLLYDPIPHNYLGAISVDDFVNFWRGNRGIPKLASIPSIEKLYIFGYLNLGTKKKWDFNELKDLAYATVKTRCYEFLTGSCFKSQNEEYFVGYSANVQLTKDIVGMAEKQNDTSLAKNYVKCLCDSKYSRYYFRDLLRSLAIKNRFYTDSLVLYNELTIKWNQLGKIAQKQLRDNVFIGSISLDLVKYIHQLTCDEMFLCDKIFNYNSSTLLNHT